MNARREVINAIQQSVRYPDSPYREIFYLPEIMLPNPDEIPPMSVFLRPEPDVEGREERLRERDNDDCAPSVLGSYQAMRSPGVIKLNKRNLIQFFWRLVLDIDTTLPGWQWRKADVELLSGWVVDKTYYHERFHHSMDVLRHLFDVQTFDPLQEEALAVAYSRYHLYDRNDHYYHHRHRSDGHILLEAFFRHAFCYTSPGYRDWPHYSDIAALQTGVCDYLGLKNSTWLKASRVPVDSMVFELLLVEGGFEERVV